MIIHGFAFWKFAKPAYEHHLQVDPRAKPAFHPLTGIITKETLKPGFKE
jgi:hypothetical protein